MTMSKGTALEHDMTKIERRGRGYGHFKGGWGGRFLAARGVDTQQNQAQHEMIIITEDKTNATSTDLVLRRQ